MAKCGVTNIGGGGGISSDEVSAAKENVLSGKTYVGVDTGDEIGTGTMANNGINENKSLNAGSSFLVKKGYHAQDFSVGANSLASQTTATASPGHLLSGQTAWVNGVKINGGIPWQNAEVSGTDRAWSQGMSNWAGTINLKVRNGHYLNGVNWIQQDVPEYQPWNIKKGVNIGGVVGTFQGYVPTATDLYLRGNNIAGFKEYYKGNVSGNVYYRFDSGQITRYKDNGNVVWIAAQANLTGCNYVNVQFYTGATSGTLLLYVSSASGSQGSTIIYGTAPTAGISTGISGGFGSPGTYTYSLNVSAINANSWVKFTAASALVSPGFYIYRIWLS